jgi:AcrR family transcriptional regulator/DNA-binding MarR family transcriptional regulator
MTNSSDKALGSGEGPSGSHTSGSHSSQSGQGSGLPTGPEAQPREQVSEIQRTRILAAMVEVVCDVGFQSASVARVTARAGVSRRTFYDLYEDRGECFLAVFDEIVAQAGVRVTTAYAREHKWVDGVRAGLFALLVFLDEEPQLAQVSVVQAPAVSPSLLARRAEILQILIAVIEGGRGLGRGGLEPSPLTGEGVVGAVLSVIHARLLEPSAAPLRELLGSLMSMIVLPYLGAGAAQRELTRPIPSAPPGEVRSRSAPDPLSDLDMRLTYRTLRVLAVIDEQPGISNRGVADRAGVTDQGQISRLLGRLEGVGLVENTGEGHVRGAPNAWRLTPRGTELQRAISSEAELGAV